MPIVYRSGLSDSKISAAENSLGRKFPPDYRKFLSEKNGLFISPPDYSEINTDKISNGTIAFDRLFGLDEEEECNDLLLFNGEFIEELRFLGGAIAIGEDGGGNPYVLVTEGEHSGVYYWDRTHLHEADSVNKFDIAEVDDSGNLFLVARSFDELYSLVLASLGDTPMHEQA